MNSTFTVSKAIGTILAIAVMSAIAGQARGEDLPDLIVDSLTVLSYSDTSITYSYVIKNIGSASAVLYTTRPDGGFDCVGMQAYLSPDQDYNNAERIPACGRCLVFEPEELAPGETIDGSFIPSCGLGEWNPNTHRYLVMMVDQFDYAVESDESNNTLAAPLEPGSEPDISVSPISVDFGQVELDTYLEVGVEVLNKGASPLEVSSICLGEGSDPEFSITQASLPPIYPDCSETINVTFSPTEVRNSIGAMEIVSDDPDQPAVDVPLEGAGIVVDSKATVPGDGVLVELIDKRKRKKKVSVRFDKVTKEGETQMVMKEELSKSNLPDKMKLGEPPELIELKTTAQFEGIVELKINYGDAEYEGSKEKLKVLHKKADGSWKDITKEVDVLLSEIVAETDSFSDFGIFEVDAFSLINGLISDVVLLNLQQGIENSLDAKLDAALKAVDDFNAYNDVAAVNALRAFISAVQAQSANKIPSDDAEALIAAAEEVISGLSNY